MPVGTVLGELRPGEAEHHDRCIRDRRREAGEQVEQRRLGPLDVVDDDDERPGAGGGGEEVADRPGRLLRGRGAVGEPEQLRDRRPHDDAPRRAVDARLDERPRLGGRVLVPDPGELAHDLADRPVGDALPVGEARAADDPGPCSDPRDELRHEARLAHARLADDRHQPALRRRESGSELPLEQLELLSPGR